MSARRLKTKTIARDMKRACRADLEAAIDTVARNAPRGYFVQSAVSHLREEGAHVWHITLTFREE
jgi:hypothetical protein